LVYVLRVYGFSRERGAVDTEDRDQFDSKLFIDVTFVSDYTIGVTVVNVEAFEWPGGTGYALWPSLTFSVAGYGGDGATDGKPAPAARRHDHDVCAGTA
jgi:hypothetical protein